MFYNYVTAMNPSAPGTPCNRPPPSVRTGQPAVPIYHQLLGGCAQAPILIIGEGQTTFRAGRVGGARPRQTVRWQTGEERWHRKPRLPRGCWVETCRVYRRTVPLTLVARNVFHVCIADFIQY
jgi:hypothetical protein